MNSVLYGVIGCFLEAAWPLGLASVDPGRSETETNHVSCRPGSERSTASLRPNQHTYPPTKQTYFGYVDAADVCADNSKQP
jgi:hypothetical protein